MQNPHMRGETLSPDFISLKRSALQVLDDLVHEITLMYAIAGFFKVRRKNNVVGRRIHK